jgi:single-stranded DNA-binding protein
MSFNSFMISGRLTSDPKTMMTKKGTTIVTFCIAQNKGQDQAFFFPTYTNEEKTMNYLTQYCHRGDFVEISGRITSKSITDQTTGKNHSELGIIAYSISKVSSARPKEEATNAQASNSAALEDNNIVLPW